MALGSYAFCNYIVISWDLKQYFQQQKSHSRASSQISNVRFNINQMLKTTTNKKHTRGKMSSEKIRNIPLKNGTSKADLRVIRILANNMRVNAVPEKQLIDNYFIIFTLTNTRIQSQQIVNWMS